MSELMKENKMGYMSIGKLLASMSWPAICSMIIQALYNIVDSIFVSQISEDALTALTYAFPVQMLIIGFAVGTGVGVNSLVSRRLGAKRYDEAISASNHSMRLAIFNWLIFAIFGLFFADFYMNVYTETSYILSEGTAYLKIVTIGSVFINVSIIIEKLFQATGSMKIPMISAAIGGISNIILDPILIFGLFGAPEMGIAGAAIATIIAQFLSFLFAVVFLIIHNKTFCISFKHFKYDKQIIKDIYVVALPGMIMQSIGSIMLFGLNGILAAYSETAVAVLGAYFRLQSFVFMPVFGLNQGTMPIIGFNFGARNRERVMKTFKYSFLSALTYMALGFIVFQLFPAQLLYIFKPSAHMLEIGIPALKLISICFIPASFGVMCTTLFQATGHGTLSLFGSLIRQLIGILPLAWILIRIGGVTLVWAAFPLAEILGTLYALFGLRYVMKKEINTLDKTVE